MGHGGNCLWWIGDGRSRKGGYAPLPFCRSLSRGLLVVGRVFLVVVELVGIWRIR